MGEISCVKKLKTSEVNVVDATFTGFVVPNGKNLNYVLEYFNNQINGLLSSSGAIVIKDEGTTLTSTPASLNFVGTGVTATTVGNDVTVSISGGSGSGTVTSVGLSMPSAFSVSNSPITSSGTIAVTGAGFTNQYIAGDGSLITFPLSLPSNQIIQNVKLGEAISTGNAVYIFSADGTNIIVKKASNATEATSSKTLGLLVEGGALNMQSSVVTNGKLEGLDTSTATIGDAVWLGTNGNLIFWHYGLTTKPVAPAHLVYIGVVTRVNSNNGEIFVNVQNGFEIDELHDVSVVGRANNTLLGYNSSTSLHEFKTVSTWLGYTPVGGTGTTNYIPKFTASGTIGNSQIQDNGSVISINGGGSAATKVGILSDLTYGFSVQTTALNGIAGQFYATTSGTGDNTALQAYAASGTGTNIAIVALASGPVGSTNYALQLVDGSEGIGKFLKSTDNIGSANWANITASDISGVVGGSGTTNYVSKFTASGTIGNSLIQDDGTGLSIGLSSPYPGVKLYVASTGIAIVGSGTTYGVQGKGGQYGVWGESVSDEAGNHIGVYGSAGDIDGGSATYIGGRFVGGGANGTNYSLWLQDNTEGVGKFLKSITSDGKANWATMSVADTGLTLTTTGTSGASTLVGNTLNIPQYAGSSSFIPNFKADETYRGISLNNNSTTVVSEGGVTMSSSASTSAQSVASTNFAAKQIRLRYFASVVSGGRYTGTRGSALLWYIHGGFRFVCDFNISDTAFSAGCQQFYGMSGVTTDLNYGSASNILVSTLLNIVGVGSEVGDTNLQIFHNDGSGTATKVDLGVGFPANRTAGAISTTVYSIQLYNEPMSTDVKYEVINKETGAIATGTVSTNLPLTSQGLNFFASRCMSVTSVTSSGQFDLMKLGVYSI